MTVYVVMRSLDMFNVEHMGRDLGDHPSIEAAARAILVDVTLERHQPDSMAEAFARRFLGRIEGPHRSFAVVDRAKVEEWIEGLRAAPLCAATGEPSDTCDHHDVGGEG